MKKYILVLFVALFSITGVLAQSPGGGPADPCATCCFELEPEAGIPPSQAYLDCQQNCQQDILDGRDPCTALPINSSLIFLIISGAALGIYFVYKNNKKSQVEI